jgi:hypothetical protein
MNSHVWKKCWRPIGIALGVFALLATPAGAASQGDPLKLGVVNTINLSTSLSGNTSAPQLFVSNANAGANGAIKGQSSSAAANAFSIYGLLTSTAPAGSSAAVRGENKGTNANGFGVWGSDAGGGTGVYGSAPSGIGTFGTSTSGIGVRAHSQSGRALYATVTGGNPAVQADTSSGASGATGVVGTATAAGAPANSAGVKGINLGNGMGVFGRNGNNVASGYGVYGEGRYGLVGKSLFGGASSGVYGSSATGFAGVEGHSANASGNGVFGDNSAAGTGVYGSSTSGRGLWGKSTGGQGIYGYSAQQDGIFGESAGANGVEGTTTVANTAGVFGHSANGLGVFGQSTNDHGVDGRSANSYGVYGVGVNGVYGAATGGGVGVEGHSAQGPAILGSTDSTNLLDSGVSGFSASGLSVGVIGQSSSYLGVEGLSAHGDGLYGGTVDGHAGTFDGRVRIDYGETTPAWSATNATLQAERHANGGEAAWFRITDSTNTNAVLMLIKQSAGTGDFMKCYAENSPGNFTQKCHVNKDGTFVSGSDFAESLHARGGKASYSPGDVLVASETRPGDVERAKSPFDRKLIGVYSTRPAVLGADKGGVTRVGKDDVPVAITGIVPVKVSAANGPIRPGDLLTSSSLPGRAMNAGRNPAIGTVLGKALGILEHGNGTIRMLVMLR